MPTARRSSRRAGRCLCDGLGDQRPKLHKRIKELQPKASVRAIGDMIGASAATVYRDTFVSNETDDESEFDFEAVENGIPVSNETSDESDQSDKEAAEAATKAAERTARRDTAANAAPDSPNDEDVQQNNGDAAANAAQPKASVRAIADMTGSSVGTVHRTHPFQMEQMELMTMKT
jgi:hypothetical protein